MPPLLDALGRAMTSHPESQATVKIDLHGYHP
jgi:hypothetical protein